MVIFNKKLRLNSRFHILIDRDPIGGFIFINEPFKSLHCNRQFLQIPINKKMHQIVLKYLHVAFTYLGLVVVIRLLIDDEINRYFRVSISYASRRNPIAKHVFQRLDFNLITIYTGEVLRLELL